MWTQHAQGYRRPTRCSSRDVKRARAGQGQADVSRWEAGSCVEENAAVYKSTCAEFAHSTGFCRNFDWLFFRAVPRRDPLSSLTLRE